MKTIILFIGLFFCCIILQGQTISLEEIDKSGACNPGVIFERAEQMPDYEGGLNKLKETLSDRVQYPKNYTGDLNIGFIVNCEGKATGFRSFNGEHEEIDRRLVDELSRLQHWRSGIQNGRAVDSYTVLRIRVKKGKIQV